MEILTLGNVSAVSKSLFQQLGTENTYVVLDEDAKWKDCKDVVFYNKRSKDNELFRLYATHDFEMVIYFSKTLESFETNYEELEELEKSLKICVEHKISNFIYITGFGPSVNDNKMAKGQYTILKHACEQLCESFAEGNGISVTVIKTPMVYSETLGTNTISHWIREASSTQPIACALAPNTMVDFLCDKDLGELLKRIVDAPRKERYTVIPLSGNNEMTVQEVQDRIVQEFPGTVVEYTSSYTEMEQGDNNKTVVRLYGWKPSHGIHEEFSLMMREWKAQPKVEEKKKPSKIFHEIRMYAELILGFVCVVVLNSWTETNILLSFLDFRMLYVIVAGITYGLGAGVAAAVLCCGNYVAQNALSTHWQILFYNVQNWLPFACYILLGTVTGYIKNKYENEMAFLKKEQEILENKYVFLNQQYIKAVENKNLFNNQIIAYQDSYGKLYSAVKKLDCTLTSEVFFEAINVLEEMLGNQSVAIYSVNGTSDYARLKVCSKSIHHELSKSLVLSEYKEMVDELQKNQTFVNTACLPAYPAYAAPIYNENSLVGMILILHADDRQMNMEFFNKFTIFASLIKDSLIRAMEYENFSNQVIEGTQIMKPETFEEILKISEQMRQKEYLEYTLIQIEHAEMDSKQLGNLVASMVRASDILGMTTNGKLQLLLNQTGKEDFSIIGERMKKHNIKFDVIKV